MSSHGCSWIVPPALYQTHLIYILKYFWIWFIFLWLQGPLVSQAYQYLFLDWPCLWSVKVTMPTKNFQLSLWWQQFIHITYDLLKQEEWGRGAFPYAYMFYPSWCHNLPLAWLLSLWHTSSPYCYSMESRVDILIDSGSMVATCTCYLFVSISRCEMLYLTPQPGRGIWWQMWRLVAHFNSASFNTMSL